MEQTEHVFTDFITLTYSPEFCPEKLDATHFDAFIRRLRKSIPARVRYFCCGEYGGKTMRPHWHVLLFGHRLPQRGLHTVPEWPMGHVFTGELERRSAQYVARYALKTSGGDDYLVRMSRRPGIGMRALRFCAAHIAHEVPEMEYFPPVMNFRKRSWWLDRHAYDACVKAYEDAGGVLTHQSAPCRDELDLKSVMSLPVDGAAREYMQRIK